VQGQGQWQGSEVAQSVLKEQTQGEGTAEHQMHGQGEHQEVAQSAAGTLTRELWEWQGQSAGPELAQGPGQEHSDTGAHKEGRECERGVQWGAGRYAAGRPAGWKASWRRQGAASGGGGGREARTGS